MRATPKNNAGNPENLERQITAIALTGDNRVELTFSEGVDDGAIVDAAVWVNTDSSRDDMNFELSEVRMNVGTVETPPGYLDTIISKVKGGKFKTKKQR